MDNAPAHRLTTPRPMPLREPPAVRRTQRPTFYTHPDGKIPCIGLTQRDTHEKTSGYRHCIYVVPMQAYSDMERRQLAQFVQEQDLQRMDASPVVGGFPAFIGRIAKIVASSRGYDKGFRWRYTTGRGDSFRTVQCLTLDELMQALKAERL